MQSLLLPLVAGLVGLAVSGPALAARADLWDVPLGSTAAEIEGGFIDHACGTDGGPPSLEIDGFASFASCPADTSGLHEVYFRYDEQLEYLARAGDRPRDARRHGGTTSFDFPVIVTFLFDEEGVLRGKRLVTDPRPEHATRRQRHEFWTLGNLLQDRFGDGWACVELDPEGREHAVGSYLVKRRCTKTEDGVLYGVEQVYLQAAGQAFRNPHTGRIEPDAFDSATRFEMRDAQWAAPRGPKRDGG